MLVTAVRPFLGVTESVIEAIAAFWDEQAGKYRCEHCAVENRLQMALAGCDENCSNHHALLRLESFAPAARVYLHHHKAQTDLVTYLGVLENVELVHLRQFVLNFLHVEHGLLHLTSITYHQWIRGGNRDRLSRMLQDDTKLYNLVRLLHTARGVNRTKGLTRLCHQIESHLAPSAITG
jgi:hypothetical protein